MLSTEESRHFALPQQFFEQVDRFFYVRVKKAIPDRKAIECKWGEKA